MSHNRMPSALVPILIVILLVAAGAVALLPESPPSPPAATATTDTLTATLHVVDTEARTFAVITGVGHALRLVSMNVDPACEIKVAARASQLQDLAPGQIIRVQYRKTADRISAESIETVQVEDARGGP